MRKVWMATAHLTLNAVTEWRVRDARGRSDDAIVDGRPDVRLDPLEHILVGLASDAVLRVTAVCAGAGARVAGLTVTCRAEAVGAVIPKLTIRVDLMSDLGVEKAGWILECARRGAFARTLFPDSPAWELRLVRPRA